MLFRPPDLQFYSLDRVALFALIFVVVLRTLVLQQSRWLAGPVTLPMLGLVLLALSSVPTEPYDAQNWSLFAAKWLVPLVLYQMAGLVFQGATSIRVFETFSLVILAYLSLTAIFFLIDARSLIFPATYWTKASEFTPIAHVVRSFKQSPTASPKPSGVDCSGLIPSPAITRGS